MTAHTVHGYTLRTSSSSDFRPSLNLVAQFLTIDKVIIFWPYTLASGQFAGGQKLGDEIQRRAKVTQMTMYAAAVVTNKQKWSHPASKSKADPHITTRMIEQWLRDIFLKLIFSLLEQVFQKT